MQFSFLVIAALLSIGLERFRQPLRPGLGAPGLHLLVMAGLFLTAYSLSRRFYFSLLAALCAQLVVLIVNNAKYRFLREPLVFADFALYSRPSAFRASTCPLSALGRRCSEASPLPAASRSRSCSSRPAGCSPQRRWRIAWPRWRCCCCRLR
ncbi:hypothetical protein [Marinobacterium aestuariivivens]|uniref:Uncharacterized protein n=1 Tax=Marinobacterium aestuariivivens TaxID=1698799 RepID=A0ABW1ZUS6_9GAMM